MQVCLETPEPSVRSSAKPDAPLTPGYRLQSEPVSRQCLTGSCGYRAAHGCSGAGTPRQPPGAPTSVAGSRRIIPPSDSSPRAEATFLLGNAGSVTAFPVGAFHERG